MKIVITPATLEDLHTRLKHNRERLKQQIADLRIAEGLDRSRDSLERREEVTNQAEQAMDQTEWGRMRIEELALLDRLTEVEHALAKFPLGANGYCEKCGQPISEARLRTLPEARFDVEHEAAFERSIHAEGQLPDPGF